MKQIFCLLKIFQNRCTYTDIRHRRNRYLLIRYSTKVLIISVFLSFDVNPDPTFHFRGNGSQNLQGVESLTVVFKFDRNRFKMFLFLDYINIGIATYIVSLLCTVSPSIQQSDSGSLAVICHRSGKTIWIRPTPDPLATAVPVFYTF